MANKKLFKSHSKKVVPYNTVNKAGGVAYSTTDEHALCQFAVTGCFGNAYYATAEQQLDTIKDISSRVSSELIAKIAIYARDKGNMKDMPAYLCSILAARGHIDLLKKIFPKVITNAKMLCNFVQIIRSGVTGRKSFGSAVKHLIQKWIVNQNDNRLFDASIGHSSPSLGDIIKMVHPKPNNESQNNLMRYILGREYDINLLSGKAKDFEVFKKFNGQGTIPVPNVDFRVLSNMTLTTEQWKEIGRNMPWNTLRLNLNQLSRHDVFNDSKYTKEIANRLSNKEEIAKSRVFPYQIMTAFQNTKDLPQVITNALQDALDIAVDNVPAFDCEVAVCVDMSGSMGSPITGNRAVPTVTTCCDVAGLIASVIMKKNNGIVVGFGDTAREIKINTRDSVMTNANQCSNNPGVGHGTNIGSCLAYLNNVKHKAKLVVIVTDCQAWHNYGNNQPSTEWKNYQNRVKGAKIVYINVQPYGTVQELDATNALNIGGFNDSVFEVMENFVKHGGNGNHFVDVVNKVEL